MFTTPPPAEVFKSSNDNPGPRQIAELHELMYTRPPLEAAGIDTPDIVLFDMLNCMTPEPGKLRRRPVPLCEDSDDIVAGPVYITVPAVESDTISPLENDRL
jgi:hypothetical protein